ncbi:MAG: 3-hydroxybutyryl-CoA dehydrogenase [Epsilonproteobacteria bacterium]|nr:MAG: 3-hydroxybutyryl-CoA dehydrogenase [Campylobacterota bacterium]RLA65009.1 MAG: 3-hydroxybutyryl-CoA dehydrogenase [Campylobacterota bacterium]
MIEVKTIGVVGAGQMGRGIAQVAAMSGYQVKLQDLNRDILAEALEFITEQLHKGVKKGKWEGPFVVETLSRIQADMLKDPLAECDLVIEAATENKDLKFKIFKELDQIVKKDALLASNTSSISITEIAAQTSRPSQVAGMHFMNPVPIMKLVEGIKGLQTSNETFEAVRSVAEKMGKVWISVKDVPGFAINRILLPMINEAIFALYEGVASAEDIDTALKLGTNQPMGPLTLADFVGLDTCLAILEVLHEGYGDPKYRPCPLLKQYVAAGRLGYKTGHGFHNYK